MRDAGWPWPARSAPGVGPLIGLRIRIRSGIWRIGPAWAVLAGAMASDAALLADATPLRLVGAALLADAMWGALWRMTALAPAAQDDPAPELVRVPYYQQMSPAGRFLRQLRHLSGDADWPELVASIAAALILGALLGVPALILTIAAWAITLWGWFLARAGRRSAVCDALLNVGLPWLLGFAIMMPTLPTSGGPWLDGGPGLSPAVKALPGLLLGLAFSIQEWGIRRACLSAGRRQIGLWLGMAAVPAMLIGLHQTPIVILTAVLLLPGAWLCWRATRLQGGVHAALARSGPWRLAAMLTAAMWLAR